MIGKFDVHFSNATDEMYPFKTTYHPSLYSVANSYFHDEIEYVGYRGNSWFLFKSKSLNRTYYINGGQFDKAIKAGVFDGKVMRSTFYFVLIGGSRPSLAVKL